MTNTADDKQWDKAQSVFIDRMASRQLIEETENKEDVSKQSLPLSIGQIRAMSSGQQGTSPFGQNGSPIPMGAIRLYRAFMAREGLAFSRHARAASSDVISKRAIGAYQLELVMEEDALFITITLDGHAAPHSMILLHENGQNHIIALSDPVEDMIQEGLARNDPKNTELIALLLDPVTSITLM